MNYTSLVNLILLVLRLSLHRSTIFTETTVYDYDIYATGL